MPTKITLFLGAGILSLTVLSLAPAKAASLSGALALTVETNVEQVLHRCVQRPDGRVICGRVCPDGRISPNDYCGERYYRPNGYYNNGYGYNQPYNRGW
jgi:hypothetical protein